MPDVISSLADNASVFYKGRATGGAIRNNRSMENSDWRARLEVAIENSDKSKRQISLDSGNGAGYVHSILVEGKDPTISKLIQVCRAIPASPLFIIHGINITPDQEAVISALDSSPELTQSILAILSRAAS